AMTSLANGYGGVTTIEYAPSSNWPNFNNPPIVRTVTAVTTDDAHGNHARSTFSYRNGKFDKLERQFLGFGYVKQVRPATAGESGPPFDETTYLQDFACAGRPSTVARSGGDGALLASTVHQYQAGASAPFTCLLTAQTDITHDASFVRRIGQ